jgi:hypothetical protein
MGIEKYDPKRMPDKNARESQKRGMVRKKDSTKHR